jgi:acetyltransferase-like isoleucine patch superfamily enzyme
VDTYTTPEQIEHEARLQFLTWDRTPADIEAPEHRARQAHLGREAGASFHPTAYVAAEAAIFTTHLVLGEQSWIAGHALVRGDVEFGAHCTVNPYAMISGKVRCGDGVRIASHVSIVGFNHGFDDPTMPIHKQKHETLGITIEDDVWIGGGAGWSDGRQGRGDRGRGGGQQGCATNGYCRWRAGQGGALSRAIGQRRRGECARAAWRRGSGAVA